MEETLNSYIPWSRPGQFLILRVPSLPSLCSWKGKPWPNLWASFPLSVTGLDRTFDSILELGLERSIAEGFWEQLPLSEKQALGCTSSLFCCQMLICGHHTVSAISGKMAEWMERKPGHRWTGLNWLPHCGSPGVINSPLVYVILFEFSVLFFWKHLGFLNSVLISENGSIPSKPHQWVVIFHIFPFSKPQSYNFISKFLKTCPIVLVLSWMSFIWALRMNYNWSICSLHLSIQQTETIVALLEEKPSSIIFSLTWEWWKNTTLFSQFIRCSIIWFLPDYKKCFL